MNYVCVISTNLATEYGGTVYTYSLLTRSGIRKQMTEQAVWIYEYITLQMNESIINPFLAL